MKAKLIVMTIVLAVAGLLAGCENKPEGYSDNSLAGSISYQYKMVFSLYKNGELLQENSPSEIEGLKFTKLSMNEVSLQVGISGYFSLFIERMTLSGKPYDIIFNSETRGKVNFPYTIHYSDILIKTDGWLKSSVTMRQSETRKIMLPPPYSGNLNLYFLIDGDEYHINISVIQ